jgi:hypothetical protein
MYKIYTAYHALQSRAKSKSNLSRMLSTAISHVHALPSSRSEYKNKVLIKRFLKQFELIFVFKSKLSIFSLLV